MDSTEKALEMIRAEWIAQGSPAPAAIAKRANNMPAITVRRYLDGSTKHGDPAKVRALAIALGRSDIAEGVKDVVSTDLSDSIMKYMAEKFLLWRESNLEELDIERRAREDASKRHTEEVERLTKTTGLLITRVEKLEEDKAKLVEDKGVILGELKTVRDIKRKHDALLVLALVALVTLLIAIVVYLFKFDLPNPGYGILG